MQDSPTNRLAPHWKQITSRRAAPGAQPQHWGEMAKSWEDRLEKFMGDHPKLTVAAAAAVGRMLGWMVKRK